nr:MAG TPA: hypothetical protein [Caudoviricetes sp.]
MRSRADQYSLPSSRICRMVSKGEVVGVGETAMSVTIAPFC